MPVEKCGDICYEKCEGVYQPAEDTFLLMETLKPCGKVLELGAGTGILAIYCAKRGFETDASDISDAAIECIKKNAAINKVNIKIIKSDLFHNINGLYDTIIFNPPYLPTQDNLPGSEQWDGGMDGFAVIRRFLGGLKLHLSEEGSAFTILSDLTDIKSIVSEFSDLTFKPLKEVRFDFESIWSYMIKQGDDLADN